MPPKKKNAPKAPTARARVPTARLAKVRADKQAAQEARAAEARVASEARRKEEQESIHEVDQEFEYDQPAPGVAPTATARPLTTDDLLAVIAQLQKHHSNRCRHRHLLGVPLLW